MLGNFLIGLREGLEATLVVSILVAYLVKSGRSHLLPRIWVGVAIAIGVCVAITVGLGLLGRQLTFQSQEIIGGSLSIVAAGFVTWMIFWMAGAARTIGTELRGQVDAAAHGSGWGLVLVAVLAVGREGLETTLILWSNTRQATGSALGEQTATPVIAALLGIATAVVLGYLLYRGAISINLTRFFTWTGALLIFVAAGVLSYGVHDLQEAGVLPGLNTFAFDVSHVVSAGSWYGTVLKGVFNFSPQTTWLEAIVWVAYVVPVLTLFVRRVRRPVQPAPAAQAEPQQRAAA
ncbi:iron uptake transporter permease EfeU [Nocardioides sp. GY 10127]|uniref:iron uptake transporter permease EfeU n=1 Tax=Nocardioides sp. GY 10127 TaxID=2569762 RepID=UPI0010A786B2|nr:iron uptake transporter permease EfeU [Nocardioides sp. GY 10127]TIC80784.1 high-affinity Fe2+/Pb2+ permease [Nocardioides sp. GY 10127]